MPVVRAKFHLAGSLVQSLMLVKITQFYTVEKPCCVSWKIVTKLVSEQPMAAAWGEPQARRSLRPAAAGQAREYFTSGGSCANLLINPAIGPEQICRLFCELHPQSRVRRKRLRITSLPRLVRAFASAGLWSSQISCLAHSSIEVTKHRCPSGICWGMPPVLLATIGASFQSVSATTKPSRMVFGIAELEKR